MRRWILFWRAFDVARIIPRACLVGYAWQMWHAQLWFEALKDPNPAQAAFTSTVWAMGPILLSFYMTNGVKWAPPDEKKEPA